MPKGAVMDLLKKEKDLSTLVTALELTGLDAALKARELEWKDICCNAEELH